MVLGDGASETWRGGHQIPASLPGVAYVMTENRSKPTRVRFPYHDDNHIRAMAALYGRPAIQDSEAVGR
jgi:S-DNA-T family DNA segregation ATPase FtsK/SpoIIIE